MRKRIQNNEQTFDGEYIPAEPPLVQRKPVKLATVRDCRRELAKVYNDARTGLVETQDASRLAFILGTITKTLELETFEQRIAQLESKK